MMKDKPEYPPGFVPYMEGYEFKVHQCLAGNRDDLYLRPHQNVILVGPELYQWLRTAKLQKVVDRMVQLNIRGTGLLTSKEEQQFGRRFPAIRNFLAGTTLTLKGPPLSVNGEVFGYIVFPPQNLADFKNHLPDMPDNEEEN
jgi:hypothetical protein